MAANLSLRHVYERLLQQLPKLSTSMENQQKKAKFCSGCINQGGNLQGRNTLAEMFVNNARANSNMKWLSIPADKSLNAG